MTSAPTWRQPYSPMPGPTGLAYAAYSAALHRRYRRFTLQGLIDDGMLDLREVYVPLLLAETQAHEEDVTQGAAALLSWLEHDPCLVISGPPGSGKTTLVRHLMSELASRVTNDATRALPDHLVFPLLLRDLSIDRAHSLDDLIMQAVNDVRGDAVFSLYDLAPFWSRGRFVVLLDGLDELGTTRHRYQVWRWLAEFQQRHAGQGFYIVTSQPGGLADLELASDGSVKSRDPVPVGRVLHLRPFDRSQIEHFCRRFFALPAYRKDGERKAAALLAAIAERDDLRELAQRPAYLTMMAFTYAKGCGLPVSRADLYKGMVTAYLEQLAIDVPGRPEWPHSDIETLLARLAYLATTRGQPSWTRLDLVEEVAQVLATPGFRVARPEHARHLVQHVLARSGILIEHAPLDLGSPVFQRAESTVQFGHPSFQAYLAAVYLHAMSLTVSSKAGFAGYRILDTLGLDTTNETATLFMVIDAAASHGRGHGTILRQLDLANVYHAEWLAELLGGHDIEFSENERAAWIAGLMRAAMTRGARPGPALARRADNAAHVARWLDEIRAPGQDDVQPSERLRRAVQFKARQLEKAPRSALERELLGAVDGLEELWHVAPVRWDCRTDPVDRELADRELAAVALMGAP